MAAAFLLGARPGAHHGCSGRRSFRYRDVFHCRCAARNEPSLDGLSDLAAHGGRGRLGPTPRISAIARRKPDRVIVPLTRGRALEMQTTYSTEGAMLVEAVPSANWSLRI